MQCTTLSNSFIVAATSSLLYGNDTVGSWLSAPVYPDYIVMKKDGTVWVIETKGGEHSGHSDNIDIQIANKFLAFKNYAEKYNLQWGFVRNIDNNLFINNTEFVLDMSDEHWEDIESVFSGKSPRPSGKQMSLND